MISEQHYVVGYGSLMSHDSRLRYSSINCSGLPVLLSGWQRGWVTNCAIEKFTSVGAIRSPNVTERAAENAAVNTVQNTAINALLIPVEQISPDLQQREQNYRFSPVEESQLSPYFDHHSLPSHAAKFWVCEVLVPSKACNKHPIYQSYVDTCLAGCLENADDNFAKQFIYSTFGWHPTHEGQLDLSKVKSTVPTNEVPAKTHLINSHWINDRDNPKYPRAANVNESIQQNIDKLLNSLNILQYRHKE